MSLSKLFSIARPVCEFLHGLPIVGYYIDFLTLLIASFARFGSGLTVATGIEQCKRPKKLLKLYEFEYCPYCRKVRETLSVLDLDCIIYPCPRETLSSYGFLKDSRYRPEVKKLGGKCQFPLLIDENQVIDEHPLVLYESDKINAYLWENYGDKASKPRTYVLGSTQLAWVLLSLSSLIRCLPQHGFMRIPSRNADELLELWSFEVSPFCKKVREILSSLEIGYVLRNAAKGSVKRKEFKEKYGDKLSNWRKKRGVIQVPLLLDSNTGIEMFESEDIKKYLIKTYQDDEDEVKSKRKAE